MARTLPFEHWTQQRDHFSGEIRSLLDRMRPAGGTIKSHPVFGFLFTYYSFREARLERWSPGAGVVCQGAGDHDFPGCSTVSEGAWISPESFPPKRASGLSWAIALLRSIETRTSAFGCFGLHEWAMVYREPRTRHDIPLRLGPEAIADVVEAGPLCCTHYDAFRFFSREAVPLNRRRLERTRQVKHEQGGCLHANMDLYKWAYKFYPWIGSDLILEAFQLARDARVLDMRASPYDLADWGFEPVRIETPEGRKEYESRQRELAHRAIPIRRRLLNQLEALELDRAHSIAPH